MLCDESEISAAWSDVSLSASQSACLSAVSQSICQLPELFRMGTTERDVLQRVEVVIVRTVEHLNNK